MFTDGIDCLETDYLCVMNSSHCSRSCVSAVLILLITFQTETDRVECRCSSNKLHSNKLSRLSLVRSLNLVAVVIKTQSFTVL